MKYILRVKGTFWGKRYCTGKDWDDTSDLQSKAKRFPTLKEALKRANKYGCRASWLVLRLTPRKRWVMQYPDGDFLSGADRTQWTKDKKKALRYASRAEALECFWGYGRHHKHKNGWKPVKLP